MSSLNGFESVAYVCIVLIGLWRILDESTKGEIPAQRQKNQTVTQRIAAKHSHHRGAQPSGEAITYANSLRRTGIKISQLAT